MNHMSKKPCKALPGGNMSLPILHNNLVYKEPTIATNTIHQLLCFVRSRGIDWVPESLGVGPNGKHVLSYIEGTVPHDRPDWIWGNGILIDVAARLRQWHDVTAKFQYKTARWLLDSDEVHEVICHNDCAPYNCVFRNEKLIGLIDFDVCSPGSRIWDIAYTAYRFIPLFPDGEVDIYYEVSPFSTKQMMSRLKMFLDEYGCGDPDFLYDEEKVIAKVEKRLNALADWSKAHGLVTKNRELVENARMYSLHAKWVKSLI